MPTLITEENNLSRDTAYLCGWLITPYVRPEHLHSQPIYSSVEWRICHWSGEDFWWKDAHTCLEGKVEFHRLAACYALPGVDAVVETRNKTIKRKLI